MFPPLFQSDQPNRPLSVLGEVSWRGNASGLVVNWKVVDRVEVNQTRLKRERNEVAFPQVLSRLDRYTSVIHDHSCPPLCLTRGYEELIYIISLPRATSMPPPTLIYELHFKTLSLNFTPQLLSGMVEHSISISSKVPPRITHRERWS